jgi:hypothetical protein
MTNLSFYRLLFALIYIELELLIPYHQLATRQKNHAFAI